METNGTTRIEMESMNAIIDSSKSLRVISDTLNDILKAIKLPQLCLTEDEKWDIYLEMRQKEINEEVRKYADANGITDPFAIALAVEHIDDYVFRFDEEDIRDAFNECTGKEGV